MKNFFKFAIILVINSAYACDPTLMVAGYLKTNDNQNPLVMRSGDSQNWLAQTIPVQSPFGSTLQQITCSHNHAVCVAVGYNDSGFLLTSQDDGSSWQTKLITIDPALKISGLNDVTCHDNTCVTVGNAGLTPIIAVSQDSGNTWERKITTPITQTGWLSAVSCTGSSAHLVCAAGGFSSQPQPSLYASLDNGNTWNLQTITNFPADVYSRIHAVACYGGNTQPICLAVGDTNKFISPTVLLQSDADFKTWHLAPVIGSRSDVYPALNSVTCNHDTSICVAVGYEYVKGITQLPIIATSIDHAQTWHFNQKLLNLNKTGYLNDVSCTDGPNPICTAVGKNTTDMSAMILVSEDQGATWQLVQAIQKTLPSHEAELLKVHCIKKAFGNSTFCYATGASETAGIILTTHDPAQNWQIANIDRPEQNYFYALTKQ